MSIKLSFIIPVYNTEEFLPKCINSVINQSYYDIEIIIVNDGSSGNCDEIAEHFQQLDNRIIYLKHEKNKGSFLAREEGTKKAKGEYIIYVDSDDWVDSTLAQQIRVQIDNKPELIIFDAVSVKKRRQERALWTNTGNKNYNSNALFPALCTRSFTSWAVWGKAFRRDLSLEIYNQLTVKDRLIMAEDLLFFFCYSYLVNTAIYAPHTCYYYNLTNISVNRIEYTVEKAKEHLHNLQTVIINIEKFSIQNNINSEIYKAILIELTQTYLIRLLELNQQNREKILPEVGKVFGLDIIFEFVFDDVRRRDYRLYHTFEHFFSKIFPKPSKRYRTLRYILVKIKNLIS